MKNYFTSGNGHAKELATQWFTDISETMNKTYKKQMDISAEMYNQLIGIPFSKEKTTPTEDFLAMKIFKSNMNLFGKNIETYADLTKKMSSLITDSFYKENEIKNFSDKMSESLIEMYEKQIKQMKEFNNYFLEALEKNTTGTPLDASHIIENFKNNVDENLDSSFGTFKSFLKQDNKKPWEEINKQMDAVLKSNLTFWSDLILSMSRDLKKEQKETSEATVKKTKKEPLGIVKK